jgi:hypothetical protein
LIFNGVARPIRRQQTFPHISMKRRMWPIEPLPHETMLHWIKMDVIDVSREVAFIANGMLPEPPLPKREVTIRPTHQLNSHINQRFAEMTFISPPAPGEIRIG